MSLAMLRTSVSRVIRSSTSMTIRASTDGTIREAGGKWKDKEMADENQYFRKLQAQQLKDLAEHHHDQIADLEADIKRLEAKRDEHKAKLEKLAPKN